METKMSEGLIARCGMNCRLCIGFMREKNPCFGCRSTDPTKLISRVNCQIKNCQKIISPTIDFCYNCASFPCTRLKQLDKRYRTKYQMSMIDNLHMIKEVGLHKFVLAQDDQWRCDQCGSLLSVHRSYCLVCHKPRNDDLK